MTFKEFIVWLCSDPAGHFALAVLAMAFCSLTWLVIFFHSGPGPATPVAVACGALFQLFLTKLRS